VIPVPPPRLGCGMATRFIPAPCRFVRAGVDSCAFFPIRLFVAFGRLQYCLEMLLSFLQVFSLHKTFLPPANTVAIRSPSHKRQSNETANSLTP